MSLLTFTNLPAPLYQFLDYLKQDKNYSDQTVYAYASDLSIFFKWVIYNRGGVISEDLYSKDNQEHNSRDLLQSIDLSPLSLDFVGSISEAEINEYFRFISHEFKVNINAKTRKISSLKSFYKYHTIRAKNITSNPVLGLEYPKAPQKKHIYLSLDEVNRLFKALENMNKDFMLRNKCILTLFLNTGIRLSELTSLDLSSIRSDFSYLSVIGKGDVERFVPLNKSCQEVLKQYLEHRPQNTKLKANSKNALFLSKNYTRLTPRAVQNMFKDLVKLADLPHYITIHKLRHTFATHLYNTGAVDVLELQQLLGHKDISTTKIYTHVSQERLMYAVEKSPFNS